MASCRLLCYEPDPAAVEQAMAHANDQDHLAVVGRGWYWLPSAGISTSALDVKAVERALGLGTPRTFDTVTRLHARLLPDPWLTPRSTGPARPEPRSPTSAPAPP
jgi:hypothetical protein